MRDSHPLRRLVDQVRPSPEMSASIRKKLEARIAEPRTTFDVVASVQPSQEFKETLRKRILSSITPPIGEALRGLSTTVTFPLRPLKFLEALEPTEKQPVYHAWIRWSAAFVLVVLAFRLAPLAVLSPTQADAAVQIIPNGKGVEMLVGGVWRSVETSEVLTSAVMIRTDSTSEATILLNDDGVLRLSHDTTLRLHHLGDRPQHTDVGPSATITRGTVWALGLLPSFVEGITIETGHGLLTVNAGSASIQEDAATTSVSVFDKGVTFAYDVDPVIVSAGQKISASDKRAPQILKFSDRLFTDTWVSQNLSQDAVHRNEIAKLQEEKRQKIAGILPGETLYPVKRAAETVDAFFAFTPDAKTQKRIDQANTRLNEALALIQEGQATEAEEPLREYASALVALSETGDNSLVRTLLVSKIAEQSAAIGASETEEDSGASVELLKKAVDSVAAAVPNNTELALPELEVYLAANQLALLRRALETDLDPERAAALYAEVRPYLSTLLNKENPMLRREAQSLLLALSTLAQSEEGKATDQFLIALDTDISTYLPADADAIKVTSEELDARVAEMIVRIDKFRSPLQQYNQFVTETVSIQGDPNEGTLLRRLQTQLKNRGFYTLAEYVNTALEGASIRAGNR